MKIDITQDQFNKAKPKLLATGDLSGFFYLKDEQSKKKTTIYGLYRLSDDSLFYIGKSSNINKRCGQHRYNATVHKRDSALYKYIREIIEAEDDFEARKIITIPVNFWGPFEELFINSYLAEGCDLKNTIAGGIGSAEITEEGAGDITDIINKVGNKKYTMKEYHKNPRKISKDEFSLLKHNLEELGDLSGIVHDLNTDEIVGGNQRSKAIDINTCDIEIVHKHKKPTKTGTVAEGYVIYNGERYGYRQVKWTKEQCEKANITANKLGGDFDLTKLAEGFEFDDLIDWGWTELELRSAFKRKERRGKIGDDIIPEVPEPVCKTGDVWEIGPHRLMCGKCDDPKNVEKLMNGVKADMVFTDPPYNVNYSGRGKKTSEKINNDHMTKEKFDEELLKWFRAFKEAVKVSAPFYICHSSSSQIAFEEAMNKTGLEVKNQIIWNKIVASMGWGDYRWKHEPMFYATYGKRKVEFFGDRTEYTVWDEEWDAETIEQEIKKVATKLEEGGSTVWTLGRDSNYEHPTQKPVQLISTALLNSSKREDIVLDLFGGSGSTLIGCEKENRVCYIMEMEPKHCDTIINRYVKWSGKNDIKRNGKKYKWKTE